MRRSVVEHTAHHALDEALGSLGCRLDPDDALFAGLHGRSFLNATALGASLARLPFAAGEALSLALGAAAAAPPGAAPWPSPLAAAACVAQPLRFERGGAALGHALEREARPLSELQVALLPDDALATTLGHAQELLRRAAGLWSRRAAIELLYQAALTALLRRRLPEVRRSAVLALVAGNPGMHYPALGRALVRVARSLAHDERAAERLCSGEPCSPGELPAGPGRSALGDFLWAYRDDCLAPFELDRPRWGEEPGEVIAMLRALVPAVAAGGGVRPQGCEAPGLARARADGELARYEPLLSLPERGALRLLMGRSRRLARLEPSLEPLVLRALAIMRRTVLDVDRRLRRTEPSIEPGGAWLCRAGELGRALSTGRPELGRLIRMRAAERTRELVASPPPCFVGAPPPGPLAPAEAEPLGGLGVSPGVAEGRARLADPATGLPARIEPGDVLVLHGAAGGLAPLCAVAGALIIEIGGALSPACAVAREYGLAAVAGVRAATLRLREGERVRVDGERGRVERLEPA
ncbi:MAG: hypothetical protein HY744_22445 [Deltaproteobacteria bacterium]|nr:hypothetical protein [Deltaproteobacteria bacterium]